MYDNFAYNLPGYIIARASGMTYFLSAQLNGGVYENRGLWSDATVSQMFNFQSSIHSKYPDASYGYENWLIPDDKKEQLVISLLRNQLL